MGKGKVSVPYRGYLNSNAFEEVEEMHEYGFRPLPGLSQF